MPESRNVALQYWEALAAMDADAVAERFTPRACFRFGSGPTLHGRPAIRRLFVELFSRMAWIDWRTVAEWSQATCVVDEVDLSFVFDDGRRLTIPVTAVFRASGPRIDECRMSFYPEPALEMPGRASGVVAKVAPKLGVGAAERRPDGLRGAAEQPRDFFAA